MATYTQTLGSAMPSSLQVPCQVPCKQLCLEDFLRPHPLFLDLEYYLQVLQLLDLPGYGHGAPYTLELDVDDTSNKLVDEEQLVIMDIFERYCRLIQCLNHRDGVAAHPTLHGCLDMQSSRGALEAQAGCSRAVYVILRDPPLLTTFGIKYSVVGLLNYDPSIMITTGHAKHIIGKEVLV